MPLCVSAVSQRLLWWLALPVLMLGLTACASTYLDEARNPVPELLVVQADVPGYSNIRFWGDNAAGLSKDAVALRLRQLKEAAKTDPKISSTNLHFLTVSGGGSNGAFGAGLLVGWTAAGNRPNFDLVTGISTGSLIAPFAFLGPDYDSQLRETYTTISAKDIYKKKNILAAVTSESAADDAPLRHLVATYVDEALAEAIAAEHAKGRRLLIGTTNIDAERPVVWDIGSIASSNESGRLELIREILVASASIPGLFPPVSLKVAADGKVYDEMHVDGGTTNQVFLMPSNLSAKKIDQATGVKRKRTVYVIRNGKVGPEWSAVKPKLTSIAGKSVSALIKTQGIGDLYRIYTDTKRDGIGFNAIWVPDSFTMKEPAPFDSTYMKALFELGYETGKDGVPWSKVPPGYTE
jgi:predicted patatin/cPLA2 family phospholipase